jgi:hypothetical protein
VPIANRFGDVAIANEHRMNGGSEEPFHQQRRRLIGADEITQRSQDGPVAKLLAFAEQARGCRSQTDSLALERVECIDPSLKRGMRLVGSKQFGTGNTLPLPRAAVGRARAV